MTALEKSLKNIISSWFLTEPLLFGVACTHQLVPNPNITIPMRTGKLRIEFSPVLLEQKTDKEKEQFLRVEIYRILLGHPYTRQPHDVKAGVAVLASDVTIYQTFRKPIFNEEDSYLLKLAGVEYLKNQAARFGYLEDPLPKKWRGSEELNFFLKNLQVAAKTGELMLLDKLSFEQWYRRILFLIQETSIAGENAGTGNGALEDASAEAAALWEENEDAQKDIQNLIKKADAEQGWGGLGGNEQRVLKDECDFSFDYRRALAQFRQSIVSANRTLTRMRPSRRYGFKAMGSRYERKANILIAVDVSGSITDESFEHFSHAIKNFFFLGIIEKIDLIFFDVNLKNTKPITFRKKVELDEIKGRGGTNFQPAINYFEEHSDEYSGLIIFTDGEGDIPKINNSSKNILWILDSRLAFEKYRQWICKLPGCKATYLPF